MKLEKHKVMVQIGVHHGDDEFFELVKQYEPNLVILVEPNPAQIGVIKQNYSDIKNVFVENVAITEMDKGKVKLYVPKHFVNPNKADGWERATEHFSLVPMKDWGNDLHELEVNSMSFNSLCKKYDIIDIHFLQIDTEGYDAQILRSIDFDRINIDRIEFENFAFDSEECYSQYGENYKLYGKVGIANAIDMLQDKGFTVYNKPNDSLNIIAVKL